MILKSKKFWIAFLSAVSVLLLGLIGAIVFYLKFYHENLNRPLPLTVTTKANASQETAGYRLWFAYMKQYEKANTSRWQKITFPGYSRIQMLAGNSNTFAVGVTFKVKVAAGIWSTHHSWGHVGRKDWIQNIHWTLRIHKTGTNQYTLEAVQPTQSTVAGLPPVKDQYQKSAGIKLPSQTDKYKLQNKHLLVTYDGGKHWTSVPVQYHNLFAGDYSGPKPHCLTEVTL